ncbi:hypothetical protein ACRE7L_26990, partial [Klebsiella pneumoniae]
KSSQLQGRSHEILFIQQSLKLPPDAGSRITYRTINDYGALTPTMNGVLR